MGRYFFKEWKSSLRARPLTTLVVVILAAAGLAGSTAIRAQLSRALTWWEGRFDEPVLEAYLKAPVTDEAAIALADQLDALQQVERVEFVSADEAQREAEAYLGTVAFAILPENPLPASVRLTVAPEYRTPYHMRYLADSLINVPGIIEVISADEQVEIYSRGRQIIIDYSVALQIASLGWAVFWLFVGIFLVLRIRSPEWMVWRYLGARPGWFRWPPMAEGLTLGVLVTALAWVSAGLLTPVGQIDIAPVNWRRVELFFFFAAPAFAGCLAGWLAYRVQRRRARFY